MNGLQILNTIVAWFSAGPCHSLLRLRSTWLSIATHHDVGTMYIVQYVDVASHIIMHDEQVQREKHVVKEVQLVLTVRMQCYISSIIPSCNPRNIPTAIVGIHYGI